MAAMLTLDPVATHNSDGTFTITGKISDTTGLNHIAIGESIEDGPPTNFGSAQVAADGTFSYVDRLSGLQRSNFQATAYLTGGATIKSSVAPFELYANGTEERYSDAGKPETLTTFFRDGSNTDAVLSGGQTLDSNVSDTFMNGFKPNNVFVFNSGYGDDIVRQFHINDLGHDTLVLPSSDFASLLDVLHNTHNAPGGALITDPASGDTIKVAGVSKAELFNDRRAYFALHA